MANLPAGTVTFLFTDIEGSTKRWEANPAAMQAAFARQEAILRQAIDANGGYAYKMVGDAFQAAFPTAPQALQAAIDAQRALHSERWPAETGEVRVRMALHTGITEERGDDYVGPVLNRVARLLAAGHGGQILLSSATQELVLDALPPGTELRDMGEHRLKDLTRPERIFQVLAPSLGLPSEFPPLRTLDNRPNNLPRQVTPLVGREREVGDVCALLRKQDVALVTLTGPGGTGKTRLGLQVGAEFLDDCPDGVWFVELAALTDAGLVPSNIAQVLGVTEAPGKPLIETLQAHLAEKQTLLILDNFEQVLEASAAVASLVKGAPGVKVLVTSRVKLNMYGEYEYGVPPLSLPDIRHLPPPEGLSQYEAVRLFIERAQAARPDFEVTNDNALAVAEICVRLDGLPLAIKLAAARVKMLPPQALLARLSQRLKLLTGGARDLAARQQTLRGAIDWSYNLLSGEERQLFRRLGVFQGGCTLDAVEQVCAGPGSGSKRGAAGSDRGAHPPPPPPLTVDVFDGVQWLLDKSLLLQKESAGGEPRFFMLGTLHEYAREKLEESGETAALRREHALYFMRLSEEAQPRLRGAEQRKWMDRLEEEIDNIRVVLHWAGGESEGEQSEDWEGQEVGLRMSGAIWRYWLMRGSLSEGREQVGGVLEVLRKKEKTEGNRLEADRLKPYEANALNGAGVLADQQGDYAAAHSLLEEGLALRRELGDKGAIANSLTNLGIESHEQGDYASARSLLEESLALFREVGDKWGITYALTNLGVAAEGQGDYASARALYEESLALSRELGDNWGLSLALSNLGLVALGQGDYLSARSLLEESLLLRRNFGDKRSIAHSLSNLGLVAQAEGDYASARSLFKESLAFRKEIGHKVGIVSSLAGLGGVAVAEAGPGDGQVKKAEVERGAKLLGAVEALLESMGSVLEREDRLPYERRVQQARHLLGEEAFGRAWQLGRAMSLDEAIDSALGPASGIEV